MFGAPHQNPNNIFFVLCSSSTTIIDIQKHLCWPEGYNGMGVRGATQEPKQYFLLLCSSNTTCIGIQKHLCWPVGYNGMGVRGRHHRTQTIFFGILQFKKLYPRYPKTPLLAYRVLWYVCLGCHPRTEIYFFGIVQFKHHLHRYPKPPLLADRVQWYGCLRPKQYFWHCALQTPLSQLSKNTFAGL